jgi:hypothetical protein
VPALNADGLADLRQLVGVIQRVWKKHDVLAAALRLDFPDRRERSYGSKLVECELRRFDKG